MLEPVDSLLQTSTRLGDGAAKLTSGSATAARAMAGLPQTVASMKDWDKKRRGATERRRRARRPSLGITRLPPPRRIRAIRRMFSP